MRNYFKKIFFIVVFIGFSLARAGSYDDFFKAVGRDDAPVVQQLLARGFDPNSVAPDGQAALILALKNSTTRVAEVLIAHPQTKLDIRNRQDESPLMIAALKGHLHIVQALIAGEADVNKPGWAPLHYAATGGHPEVITVLLERYAYIDAESPNGTTPLMMAASYGNAAAVKVLLEAGADPGLKNSLGLSALDFARKANRLDSAGLIAAALKSSSSKATW